jgi:hypothetical protein
MTRPGKWLTQHPVSFAGKKALKLLNYVYKDSTKYTRMERKYKAYLSVLGIAKEKGWL